MGKELTMIEITKDCKSLQHIAVKCNAKYVITALEYVGTSVYAYTVYMLTFFTTDVLPRFENPQFIYQLFIILHTVACTCTIVTV